MANIKRANTSGVTKSGTAISDVPDAPTIGTATAVTYSSATVAYTAAVTGGTPTYYIATSTPGSITATSASSPITVTGLTASTSYTFTVKGYNSTATGAASAASNTITTLANTNPYNLSLNGAGYLFNPQKDGSGTYTSTRIEKFDFSTESRTTISATMPDARGASAGFGNATTAGYIAGGILYPSVYDTTQKLTYSGESRSQISATFNTARFNNKGFGNTAGTSGYMAGGQDLNNFYQTIRKLAFSNDTWSSVSATLNSNRAGAGAAANPSVAGYWAGGYNGSSTSNTVDKISFSNDTVSSTSTMPITSDNLGSMNNTAVASYSVGGNTTGIYKLVYSNDTWSTLSATMPYKNNFSAYWSCPGNLAVIAGARLDPYPDVTNAIQKISYTTDTQSTSSSVLQAGGETSNYGVSNAALGA